MFLVDLLWAAFMYWIYTCLSDLWALPRVPFQGVSLLHSLPGFTSCVEPRFYAAPFKFKFNQKMLY